MQGLHCPKCRAFVSEAEESVYRCHDCDVQVHIPYSQDGSIHYRDPERAKGLVLPITALAGIVLLIAGIGPTLIVAVSTAIAYVLFDSLVWALRGVRLSHAFAVRSLVVFIVAISAWVGSTFVPFA